MADIPQNKLKIFLIVGLGNIGLRHLESLIKTKNSLIYINDKNEEILNKTIIKYKKKNVKKIKNFDEINENIDLAIIATNSDVRPKILTALIKYSKVKNIILEKVVFQKILYFNKFIKIAKLKKIKIYVNYPRRFWKIFQFIKKEINNKKTNFEIIYKANNWGLCCNSVHFIDLFYFLSYLKIDFVNSYSFLNNRIYRSKRINFYELKGRIHFECNNHNKLILVDDKKYKYNLLLIKFANLKYKITTKNDYLIVNKVKDDFTRKKNEKFIIKFPKQSDLTNKYFYYLSKKNENFFSSLKDSYSHHKIFFNAIKNNFSERFNKLIPIT